MPTPKHHGPSPDGAASVVHRLIVVIGVVSPLITYLIATSPFSYAAKIAGVIAVSACSAAVSIYYVSRQNRGASNRKLDAAFFEGVTAIPVAESAEPALSKSLTDAVTGLPNERALEIVLENQLTESRLNEGERPLGVIVLEVRDLDVIDERHGAEVRDRLLHHFAEQLLLVVRKLDFVARVGDEFFVILPSADDAAVLEALPRIAKHFDEATFDPDGIDIPVRPVFGWANYPQDGDTADELTRAAVLQKEHAKSASKMFDGELDLEYVH
jgi:diguanylate cyclase (GGDEF)-like protein